MRFDLNLKQLKAFYYVARHLSFTQAAECLFITQPAVTMQISALEKQYGLRLFSRKKNDLSLTEAGKILFSYAEKVMRIAAEAERALVNLKANPHGLLRIGTTKTFARYILAPYVLHFQEAFPDVRIKVDEGSSEEMVLSVVYGRNDIAIVARMGTPEKLSSIPFPHPETDELVLVVSADHPLADRDVVELEELADVPLILRERGSGTRDVVSRAFEEKGLTPRVLMEARNVEFIKDLIGRGVGVSIMGEIGVAQEVLEGSLKTLPLAEPLAIHIDVVVPAEGHRTSTTNSFLSFLLEDNAG